jgi:hypothetical protein
MGIQGIGGNPCGCRASREREGIDDVTHSTYLVLEIDETLQESTISFGRVSRQNRKRIVRRALCACSLELQMTPGSLPNIQFSEKLKLRGPEAARTGSFAKSKGLKSRRWLTMRRVRSDDASRLDVEKTESGSRVFAGYQRRRTKTRLTIFPTVARLPIVLKNPV